MWQYISRKISQDQNSYEKLVYTVCLIYKIKKLFFSFQKIMTLF